MHRHSQLACSRLSCVVFFFEGSVISIGCIRMVQGESSQILNHILLAERGDLLKAYYERLTGDDKLAQMVAAKYWSAWKGAALSCDQAQKHWQVLPSSKMPSRWLV